MSRGTVYRNLNLLTEAGIITTVKAPGTTRFDWRCDGHAMRCRSRGTVARTCCLHSGSTTGQPETSYAQAHSLIFEGTCPTCQRQPQS
ncbi:MAG: transcriptional repressor [Collinsella intestinalis]